MPNWSQMKQWLLEGDIDARNAGYRDIYDANRIANWARDNGVEYAQNHGYSQTWDNEADAYRHFLWNAGMTRQLGLEAADIIGTRHETANWEAYFGVKIGEQTTLDIPLASLMDLWNNGVARSMASSPGYQDNTYDELFTIALSEGKLITSIDQVPGKYGFTKNDIIVKTVDGGTMLFVNATFDSRSGTVECHSNNSGIYDGGIYGSDIDADLENINISYTDGTELGESTYPGQYYIKSIDSDGNPVLTPVSSEDIKTARPRCGPHDAHDASTTYALILFSGSR